MSPRKKRPPTSDALEILHRRYYEGQPERIKALEQERARAAKARLRTALARGEKAIAAGKGHRLNGVLAEADAECPLDVLQDILRLVDEEVSLAWLRRRSTAERAALLTWAGKIRARANDHPVRVPPRPACLPARSRKLSATLADVDTPAGRATARQVIRRHPNPDTVLHVTPRDMDRILETLKNPPAPNARLVAAARRYRAEFLRERCPTCGQRTLAHVVEDVTLWPGRRVKQLAHLRCDGCGERLFDVAAMDRIAKVQPRAKSRVAAKLEEFRRELDRRLAALDRGETVDPAAVKAELAARSRARRQALRPGTAHLTPHEVVERRVRKAGRKKP